MNLCRRFVIRSFLCVIVSWAAMTLPLPAQQISLQALVTPSTVIQKNGNPVTFALHGFIEFKSLNEMFAYIESQDQRWKSASEMNETQRQAVMRDLLRRGVESRVVSMVDERPLETTRRNR